MEGLDAHMLAVNFASNCGTLALALGIFVAYKRLTACNSKCHTSFCDIESPAIKEKRTIRKLDLIKRALREFRTESIKSDAILESINVDTRPDESFEHQGGHAL